MGFDFTPSPYSAAKVSADLLVLAYHHTFDLPVQISRPSNNYGSYHFPEKLIPLIIANCLNDKLLPVYGTEDAMDTIKNQKTESEMRESVNRDTWNEQAEKAKEYRHYKALRRLLLKVERMKSSCAYDADSKKRAC